MLLDFSDHLEMGVSEATYAGHEGTECSTEHETCSAGHDRFHDARFHSTLYLYWLVGKRW